MLSLLFSGDGLELPDEVQLEGRKTEAQKTQVLPSLSCTLWQIRKSEPHKMPG